MSAEVTITSDFDEKWKEFEKRVKDAPGQILEEFGEEFRTSLAETTPVKSGRASGSWNASLNAPDLTVQPEGYENPGGAYLDGNSNLRGARDGDTVYITNAIDYIDELNSGSSRQAPAGFVEAEVASARDRIMQIVERIRSRS